MSRQPNKFLLIIVSILVLIFFQWACKKKDVFPSQQLPEITSLSEQSAMAGTPIVIRGNHLKGVDNIRFGQASAANFDPSANTDTAIRVSVPDSLPVGPLYVQV